MILYVTLFIVWFLCRIYLHKSKYFYFSFHTTHHFDLPVALLWLPALLPHILIIFIIAGGIVMIDDVIGHYKAAHGGKETFILEPMLSFIFNKFFKWLK